MRDPRQLTLRFVLPAISALAACGPAAVPASPPGGDSAPPRVVVSPPPPPLPAASAEPAAAPPAPEPPAPAERFDPTLPAQVPVSGDLVAQVAHGPIGNRRAIVYLHGVCGDIHKFRAWSDAAVRFGTVVAVLGDDKCTDAGRYKWGFSVERTDRRIVAALGAVGTARGTPLDTEDVILVGYSQGSSRAEALVRSFPARYRRAVLVAGPHEHEVASFRKAAGIAVVAGARDAKSHLVESADKAARAGVRARYFELPGARHGEYGPEAVRVMGDALRWVLAPGGGQQADPQTASLESVSSSGAP